MFFSKQKFFSTSITTSIAATVMSLFLLSGCNTTKNLAIDKAFLVKNKVVITDKIKNKNSFEDELGSLYKQKPTSSRRRWFYYNTEGRVQRRLGEIPTLYDENTTLETSNTMKYYLQNKGYYDADVKSVRQLNNQKAKVKYMVTLNKPYLIDKVTYKSSDENILKIMEATQSESLLKEGKPLDVNLYNAEVTRLTKAIRNFGYANFYPNYFSPLEADTINHKANITLEALKNEDRLPHNKYKIRDIYVVTEYVTVLPPTHKDTTIEGIRFTSPSGNFNFRLDKLLACIPIRKGELFRQENLELMYSRFEELKAFRLINIKQSTQPINKQDIDIVITLAQNTKYSIDAFGEVNYTVASQRSNALGLALSMNFKDNNVFKGGEKYNGNIEGGIQGLLLSKEQRFLDLKFQNDYYLPKYYDVFGFWKKLNRIKINDNYRLLSNNFNQNLRKNAQTKFTLSYNYIQTIDLKYQLINFNYGYIINPSVNKMIAINHTSWEWLKPISIGPAIDTLPFQRKRFAEQFVTSIFFKDLIISKTGIYKRNRFNWNLRTSIGQSGLEIFGINKIYNTVALKDSYFKIAGSDYTRFIKGELNYTLGKKLGGYQSLHFRSNFGAAMPYGGTSVPFVKQFIVGGPSSLRAWRVRELGPGGSLPTAIPSNQLFYQSGDIKSELNAEYRFGIYWIFKGAFFVDAGNVWLVRKDASLPDAAFSKDFYKQIAIGAGAGIRIDFDYQVIRFDFAYRLRNPYLDNKTQSHWNTNNLGKLNWNIALGYPF